MSFFSRSLALGLVLLVGFLGITLTVQWWLLRETSRLRKQMLVEAGATLEQALALAPADSTAWNDDVLRRLAGIVGGPVAIVRVGSGPTTAESPLTVECPLPGRPGWSVRAVVQSRAFERIQLMHQRALVAIILLAALLVLVPVWLAALGARRNPDAGGNTHSPWLAVKAHAAGMEHFAKISVERGDALEKEHGARLRAEEDLEVNRSLLDRSLAERIRLGRELHDNISQTLYAVSLTIEGTARKIKAGPDIAGRFDQCVQELRRLNREVRTYIRVLEPDAVNRQPLSDAISAMLASLPDDTGIRIEQRIDDDVVTLVPPQQAAEIVSILREAISNSLRHSGAGHITVRAERGDEEVVFAVVDDGRGFVPRAGGGGGGHGLANMEARAAAIGGAWRLHSSPGNGTRILLTLPVRYEA